MPGVVISPYYREPQATIEDCLLSVARQTVPVYHTLISDGFPQTWFDHYLGVRHIKSTQHFHDWGNTPRSIAMQVEYGAPFIAFLDADNLYDPDHIAACLEVKRMNPDADFIVTQERFLRPTKEGGWVVSSAKQEPQEQHCDTSCYLFFPQCYDTVIRAQSTAPDSYVGDRYTYACLKEAGLRPAFTNRPTVTYRLNHLPAHVRHPLP
jgi:hypothetical protein